MPDRPVRVLVFPPLFTEGGPTDMRMLGFQWWLADQLSQYEGLEGASVVLVGANETERGLIPIAPPADEQVHAMLCAMAARFGVLASFAVLGGRPQFAVARIVKVVGGDLGLLARWKLDGDGGNLPAAAHGLLVETLTRIGYVLAPSTWQQLFGTGDTGAATNYLTALGCLCACEQSIRLDDPDAALRSIGTAISVGMEPAILRLPEFIATLRSCGEIDVEVARAFVTVLLDAVPRVPAAWTEMVGELGLGAAPLGGAN